MVAVTKPARKLEKGEVFRTDTGTLGWTYQSTHSGRSLFDKPVLVAYWPVDDEFNRLPKYQSKHLGGVLQQLFDRDDTVVVVGFREVTHT